MPGIVGIISQNSADQCEPLVECMLASMHHAPCYLTGRQSMPTLGIYCGWIVRSGSFAAKQMFFDRERDAALFFSGECFPDGDTCALLRRRGHIVNPNSGEWLLPLYAEVGEQFFAKLNGLFSGFLVDKRQSKAFL